MTECKLTTHDNPFDPFEQFDDWFLFDTENGYYSCSRLMRIAQVTEEMSQVEIDAEIERAIDEIIKYDDANIYKKVVRIYEENDETDLETSTD